MDQKTWHGSDNILDKIHYLASYDRLKHNRRRLLLWACSCVRDVWDEVSDPARQVVLWAENVADGGPEKISYPPLVESLSRGDSRARELTGQEPWFMAARYWDSTPLCQRIANLHDIFGNPFDDIVRNVSRITSSPLLDSVEPSDWTRAWEEVLTWNNQLVVKMAWNIYRNSAFQDLPVLGDMLEDSGVNDKKILDHCHSPGLQHVRGCWVVDLFREYP